MSRASRRIVVLVAVGAWAWASAACVDLFHSTKFDLCKTDPETGACVDASSDADVDTDAPTDAD